MTRSLNRVVGPLAALAALAIAAAACGGSSSSDKTSTPASGSTVAATQPASAAATAATKSAATSAATKSAATAASTARTEVDSLKVTAKDFSFTLSLTSIHPGAPGVDVEFVNEGGVTHQVAFYEDAAYTKKIAESQPVAPAGSSSFPFIPPTGADKVYYRCEIHPTQMQGELPVQ